MAEFMIIYGAGTPPETKEDGDKHMQEWQQWIQSLGDKIINPGTPLMHSKIIDQDGVSEVSDKHKVSGFAVIKAGNMDEALEIAKGDPFLKMGKVQISEMIQM